MTQKILPQKLIPKVNLCVFTIFTSCTRSHKRTTWRYHRRHPKGKLRRAIEAVQDPTHFIDTTPQAILRCNAVTLCFENLLFLGYKWKQTKWRASVKIPQAVFKSLSHRLLDTRRKLFNHFREQEISYLLKSTNYMLVWNYMFRFATFTFCSVCAYLVFFFWISFRRRRCSCHCSRHLIAQHFSAVSTRTGDAHEELCCRLTGTVDRSRSR